MKYTVFRTKKDDSGLTYQALEFNTLRDSVIHNSCDELIRQYREIFLALEKPEVWYKYKSIPQVCAGTEYYRNKAGERVFRAYNGVATLTIEGLNGTMEIEKAKKQASMMPQVLAAFAGADGHSVVVLTRSTLPEGKLPRKENDALAFCTHAYVLSVQCLQPALDFEISIKEPALDDAFLMTHDDNPYFNDHVVPFLFEQPTQASLEGLNRNVPSAKGMARLKPDNETCFTLGMVFNSAYGRAWDELRGINGVTDLQHIVRTAELCAAVGLPEEEAVMRLGTHHRDVNINELRGLVRNVYAKEDGEHAGMTAVMSKHQIVAHRLREFMERRYEIRFNEVLQMTEFRERRSLRFLFRELNRRELNAIHHEALLEGIEPTFGEVDELVHSTLVRTYNPIEHYLNNLPKWDGKDHIGMMAGRVTTDNPHWDRLFRQWFLSMVAHWLNGNELHANSTAPILIGQQGFRKSTFCRQLLPPELQMFYTDSIDFRSNTEAERMLSRFLLVNIDEFDQLSDKQFAFVKHLFQKPATNIRRMYSEAIGTQRRYASFIGTTNCDEVLRDPTGNRRYLCVMVTEPIRTDSAINYGQLYAQAVSLINNGTRYWLNDEDEALIRATNNRFEVQQPLEQLFLTVFQHADRPEEDNAQWLRSTEIMEALSTLPAFNRRTDNNLYKLGRILTKLNIVKRRYNNGTQYLVRKRMA